MFSLGGAAAVLVLCAAPLVIALGCSLQDFSHLSEEFGAPAEDIADASATETLSLTNCAGQTNGTNCDDRDVCSESSSCVEGLCAADAPLEPADAGPRCLVADSVTEFSSTQGFLGWWYGYWDAGADDDGTYQPDTDFQLATFCGGPWKSSCAAEDEPDFRWTSIMAGLQHGDTEPTVEIPVRRWVSDTSGPALARVDHHHDDPGGGDGTEARLLVDGQLVWSNQITGYDATGTQAELELELQVGTVVEQLLDPLSTSSQDSTWFSLSIHGK